MQGTQAVYASHPGKVDLAFGAAVALPCARQKQTLLKCRTLRKRLPSPVAHVLPSRLVEIKTRHFQDDIDHIIAIQRR